MTRIGPYRLHIAWHCWEWGRDVFFFANTVLLHFGPFHFVRPMTEADWFG